MSLYQRVEVFRVVTSKISILLRTKLIRTKGFDLVRVLAVQTQLETLLGRISSISRNLNPTAPNQI